MKTRKPFGEIAEGFLLPKIKSAYYAYQDDRRDRRTFTLLIVSAAQIQKPINQPNQNRAAENIAER